MPRRPPSTVAVRAPSTRTLPADAWTPDLIRQAEVSADAGQLRWAAELCDALLSDDRVQSARLKLVALLGLPLAFEDGVGRLRRRARRALEAEEDWWACFADEALGELLFWGVLLGVGIGRLTWTERRGRFVPRLTVWHPRALRYDLVAERWVVRTGDGRDLVITPGDGQWVVFTPFAELRPWSHGAWRAVAAWWRAKRYARDDWARHTEQAAGIKVATTEDGTDADRQALAADLSDAGTDAAVALPPKWDLKQLGVPASAKDVFDALIDASDDAITLTFLGQNLTTEVKGGSFAAADVHQSVSRTVLQLLASALSGCLRAQVLVPWAVYNFGAAEVAPWPVWNTEPPADKAAQANSAKTAGEALSTWQEAATAQGFEVDVQAAAERFGVPLRKVKPAATSSTELTATDRERSDLRAALAGQVYVDAVFDAAMERAPAAIEAGVLGAVRRAIRDAESYDDLRAALPAILKHTDDAAMRDLVEGAVQIAVAAGVFSVHRDDG